MTAHDQRNVSSPKDIHVLVTGASGFIGERVCLGVLAAGFRVTAMVRAGARVHAPVHHMAFGALPYEIPQSALHGITHIVHCAAATRGEIRAESHAINVLGTEFLLARARQSGTVRHAVFLSSQSAHEQARSDYGTTKLAGEKIVQESGIPAAILRPGLVYGPDDTGLFHRMMQQVRALRVTPLLGGGRAPVQPIHVDDLVQGIVLCIQREHTGLFCLGEPDALSLRDFLHRAARGRFGRQFPALPLPLPLIKPAVKLLEAFGMRPPITSENITGMETARAMETRTSLEALKLTLRPLDAGLAEPIRSRASAPVTPADAHRPVRVLLVGAGKIAIVHALDLTRRPGAEVVGLVDPNVGQQKLYRTMGFRMPAFTNLEDALAKTNAEAVVISTPARTHLDLLETSLQRGLAVLVEKPVCMDAAGLARLRDIVEKYPNGIVHAGYMAAQLSHLDHAAEAIRRGDLGTVRRVTVTCLQSHIMAPTPVRWEMLREQSGGGVLINFAIHNFAIVMRLLGVPTIESCAMASIHSTEVEDVADVRLAFRGGVAGRIVACWSAPGYARPLNRITIEGSDGELVFDFPCLTIRRFSDESVAVHTQHGRDVGYNAAPDYSGAGFSNEHENFLRAVRAEKRPPSHADVANSPSQRPVDIREAMQIEEFIFALYAAARSMPLHEFIDHNATMHSDGSPAHNHASQVLRDLMEGRQ